MTSVYFIGICGTAMATLAAMLKQQGLHVRGSDAHAYPPMDAFLAGQGIAPLVGYDAEHLTDDIDVVVIGNAVSRGNPEVEAVLERRMRYVSLPEMVRERFLRGARPIVVAGTHGKTTTTSMIAWALVESGVDPSFLVGGIPRDFDASFRLGGGDLFVIEGDEYDSAFFDKTAKFLKYLPFVAVVGSLEFDHADIYPDLAALRVAFRRLLAIVPANGRVLLGHDDAGARALGDEAYCAVETFGIEATAMGGRPGDPMKSFVPFADFGTATMAAFGIMAALLQRERTGKGQLVEAALTRTVMAFNIAYLAEEALTRIGRPAYGNRGYSAGPSDLFKTRDGAVMVQVVGQPLFERWARLMGEEHWLADPRFADDQARGDNGELLSARTAEWCRDKTTGEVLQALDDARIPCGPVLSAEQVLRDPHVTAMDFLEEVAFPGLDRPVPVTTTPVKLSETPGTIRQRAATLGEHTDEILAELGHDAAAIARLRDARVV